MSAARRSLLTATAAGTLLGALWFVPSANATPEKPVQASAMSTNTTSRTAVQASTESSDTQSGAADSSDAGANDTGADDTASNDSGTRLADTGSVNTTPYVVGGTLFLGLGAGFVTYSVRRERAAAF
ncbi:hypothetical protein ACFV8Z_19165 [Streptomyces sp. NPDC059837]|uniref:hypothetical protein n=1 Tax=unclassified Streptomyces TaxID=2593676 RepID=UPI0022511C88|nr:MULTISPECIES: hypothetical protein [unclassified Streptomyces]MCX4410570.1 hypothetical protein [Streptomyces sp. NBC_01764]MCX5186871.1 hypothetical protein [Streptomyces sp. NBC_00268]